MLIVNGGGMKCKTYTPTTKLHKYMWSTENILGVVFNSASRREAKRGQSTNLHEPEGRDESHFALKL
jgi:hypothetical protein